MSWTCFHGHTSMVQFLKIAFLKALGPWLGVNRTLTNDQVKWPCTKRWICWWYIYIDVKEVILELFFMYDLLPFLFLSFLLTMKTFGRKKAYLFTMDDFMVHNMNIPSVLARVFFLQKVRVCHGYILRVHKTNPQCFIGKWWQCTTVHKYLPYVTTFELMLENSCRWAPTTWYSRVYFWAMHGS